MFKFKKLVKNKKGQGLLEYVLLLGAVVLVMAAFVPQLKGFITSATSGVMTQANSVIGGGG